MYKLYIYLLFLSVSLYCCTAAVEDDTELLLTFLIHRHGDRTPVESSLSLSNDVDTLIDLSAKYGYGQLTDAGRRRAYELGQFLRRRYNELLSPHFNKSEIYIRSTDSTRSKMTVLTAMAAVYPTDENNWSSEINWAPVPYTTVPAKYDFNLATLNCPTYLAKYGAVAVSKPARMAKYEDFLNQWSELIGINITNAPVNAYSVYDLYTAQMGLGLPLDPEVEAIFPQIEEAAGAAIDSLLNNDDMIPFEAGVLLNEFFKVADKVLSGEDVQRVQIYSAHDINVYAFESVIQAVPKQGVPKYASALALELRKVVATGEIVVVPVYLNTPSEDVITYLQIDGCGASCTLENFYSLTSKFLLEEIEWRSLCNFSEDLVFDTSSID